MSLLLERHPSAKTYTNSTDRASLTFLHCYRRVSYRVRWPRRTATLSRGFFAYIVHSSRALFDALMTRGGTFSHASIPKGKHRLSAFCFCSLARGAIRRGDTPSGRRSVSFLSSCCISIGSCLCWSLGFPEEERFIRFHLQRGVLDPPAKRYHRTALYTVFSG